MNRTERDSMVGIIYHLECNVRPINRVRRGGGIGEQGLVSALLLPLGWPWKSHLTSLGLDSLIFSEDWIRMTSKFLYSSDISLGQALLF